jgi:hypothetical protein
VSVNDVRVAIYRGFVEDGRPPMPTEIAAALEVPLGGVEAALDELAGDGVIALLPGTHHVWLAHPFSAAAAPFRVTAGDGSWDAICIWDALGILAVIDTDGSVTTACPDCGEKLELAVRDGDISASEHVVHFAVPAARWYEDIGHT